MMFRVIRRVGAAVLLSLTALVAVLFTVFLVGMRTKHPTVIDGVRRFNRGFTNPKVLTTAGTEGASASVIRHTGRASGRQYETPIGPMPVRDGFVVALPYGQGADWVQNVLAGGPTALVHEGSTYEIVDPVVVPTTEVAADLSTSEQLVHTVFGVTECLSFTARPVDA